MDFFLYFKTKNIDECFFVQKKKKKVLQNAT